MFGEIKYFNPINWISLFKDEDDCRMERSLRLSNSRRIDRPHTKSRISLWCCHNKRSCASTSVGARYLSRATAWFPSEEDEGLAFLAFPEERRDDGDEAVDKAPAVVSSSSSSSVAPTSSSSSASSSTKAIDSVGFGDPMVSNADCRS